MNSEVQAQILDANCHPTVDGSFLDYKFNVPATLSNYPKKIGDGLEISGVMSVGLPNVGAYESQKFAEKFLSDPMTIALVAALEGELLFRPNDAKFGDLKKLGFHGVKIHPKLLSDQYTVESVLSAFDYASHNGLFMMICGWQIFDNEKSKELLLKIVERVLQIGECKLLVAHAVGKEFDEIASLSVKNKKFLLETSFVPIRYPSTSMTWIENQLVNGANLSFGTDWPDYRASDYSEILNQLRTRLSKAVYSGFVKNNLLNFLELSK